MPGLLAIKFLIWPFLGVRVDDPYQVVHMCTGAPTSHIDNDAQRNRGGSVKDERDIRLAMVSYLAIFSAIVNPNLLDTKKYTDVKIFE